ncbi:MAG: hypothetical protein GY913_04760 [Proteobacteria bacterium]|nr:hypothetical protein [Pseudomonadota bacterium]MCP4916212.1 hypothetical protein [Pseudomonadota bacterium]
MALVGFLLVHGVIAWYFAVIVVEKAPANIGAFAASIVLGMGLSGAGLALTPTAWTWVGFVATASMGGFILWLLTQRRLPDGELVVDVGDPMPPLTAATDTGTPFDLASLRGKRVMVKFFPGSW